MKKKQICTLLLAILTILAFSCKGDKSEDGRILFKSGCYPNAVLHDGKYYYTMQDGASGRIRLWCADDIMQIGEAKPKTVWNPKEKTTKYNIWSPELHYIDGKWYIYYEADDGNTDNHTLHVLENTSPDPTKGKFRYKGTLLTYKEWNWGIHPSTFINRGVQYLVWSGWPKRRSDDEVQCIYIARMKNPWTVESKRVMISQPIYEWERQWINPDGSRSAYPIYVNENPEPVFSKDKKTIMICYSASGCWTLYSALGMVYADTSSDLLNPKSWKKKKEPVFMSSEKDSIYGPSDISVVESKDGKKTYLLYETKKIKVHTTIKDVRIKEIEWAKNGMPIFGKPM